MTTLYGIKNCDTVKKARKWLDEHNVEYHFHDVREDGLEPATVDAWITELGWETVVNKRSTTWKALAEDLRSSMDAKSAATAILASPTLVKRPVLDTGSLRTVGFSAGNYSNIFIQHTL